MGSAFAFSKGNAQNSGWTKPEVRRKKTTCLVEKEEVLDLLLFVL